jgi:DNA-directed RNA polymerase specialized sigma24 family protein
VIAALTFRPTTPNARIAALFSDASWVAQVEGVVRRRVIDRGAVADILQEACAAAVAQAETLPEGDAEAKKYIAGIARNKARMHARGAARKAEEEIDEEVHGPKPPDPVEERDLWRRIAARIPAKRVPTLTWFVRVSLGDSLAEIAEEAGVDYATAQARYLRMRKELQRHAVKLGAVAAIAVLAFGLSRALRPKNDLVGAPPEPAPTHEAPPPKSLEQAMELRKTGLRACGEKRWVECLRDLDRAKEMDGDGDRAPEVQAARRSAEGGTR